jgi:myosin-7
MFLGDCSFKCIFSLQGDYIWIEPVSRREFDVAIGARVASAEGRRIQV